MLDEQDRRALVEIELGLSRQDPKFVTRMRRQGDDRRFPTVLALCVSLYVVVPMVALLFGWIAAVVTFDAFAVLIAVVLIRRRRAGR
jgi:Flp pilus assembly protein TadB